MLLTLFHRSGQQEDADEAAPALSLRCSDESADPTAPDALPMGVLSCPLRKAFAIYSAVPRAWRRVRGVGEDGPY